MPVPLEQFVKQLTSSGLLAGDTIKEFIPPLASPRDSDDLVGELVRKKKITVYQAEEISRGKAQSLILGNYVLQEKIGSGSMGNVFKAVHRRMHRIVALKILSDDLTTDPSAVSRFEREITTASKINHPNIVTVYDADYVNGTHFLVMDLIEGDDLSALVRRSGPVSIQKGCEYILQAARGLAHAHKKGIVHRDIKPANLILDQEGTIKILDMGLARLIVGRDAPRHPDLTSTSTIMGTVDFMSPEQALDTKSADERTDIYALGCTLYFILTGRTPYEGGTLMKKLLAHRENPIPSLRAVRPEVSDRLDSLFRKMLAKRVEDRFQSMDELIDELAHMMQINEGTAVLKNAVPTLRQSAPPRPLSVTPAEMPVINLDAPTHQAIDRQVGKFQRRQFGGRLVVVAAMILLLGVIVLRLKTKVGTLIVSVNEADAHVEVLDQEGKIEVSRAGGKDRLTISVDPGKHRLKVSKDGFEIFGQDLEISSGGRYPISAKLIPLGLPPNTTDPSTLPATSKNPGRENPRKKGTFPSPEFDEWITEVALIPAEKQVEAVTQELQRINPRFDGKVTSRIENDIVTEFRFLSDEVTEISPVRGLAGLRVLSCGGSDAARSSGKLSDLTPLKGLLLRELQCPNTQISDLTALNGMPLVELNIANTPVSDLSPLDSPLLTVLEISGTRVTALTPLAETPLQFFSFADTHVSDLTPISSKPFIELHLGPDIADLSLIKEMPIQRLFLRYTPDLDTQLLRSINSLESINGQPRIEFCEAIEAYQERARRPLAFEDPQFREWIHATEVLPVEQKNQAVVAKLMELNPGFDGSMSPTIENGDVTKIHLATNLIMDLSPLRVYSHLKSLDCSISKEFLTGGLGNIAPLKGLQLSDLNLSNTHVTDLTPLQGMSLRRLVCYRTNVRDLSPLHKMPLTELNLIANPVTDLSPLQGMPLTSLNLLSTPVSDLTPLQGMPLTYLECSRTNVVNFSPLKNLPLHWLSCNLVPDRDRDLIRSIKSLATINGRPAAEFRKDGNTVPVQP